MNRVLIVFPSLELVKQYHREHHTAYEGKNVFYFATKGTLKGVRKASAPWVELRTPYILLTTYASVPQILVVLSIDRRVDILIADEAHHIDAPVYKAAYSAASTYIQHTVHFSATLPDHNEPHYKYSLLKGIRDGVVRDFNIELFLCKSGEETGLLQMIDKLVALHAGKAKILIYTAEAITDGSSVRTFLARHADAVEGRGWWIKGINEDNTVNRTAILREFESDKSPASILVSCRTLSEGIDLKNANCMLPWDPTASIKDNIQRIGRVVRLYKTATGAIAKDQPPSTILIPVFLEEAQYAACDGNREAIHALLEKQISEGERGNFRPLVNVCTALKSELAQEDSDLFNQLLDYPHVPKVRVDADLVGCVARQLGRTKEEVLEEVAASLEANDELEEEVLDSIREGEWGAEETGAIVTALAESQGIRLIIRDNSEEEVVGTGEREVVVERKGEGNYVGSKKKGSASDAARKRVAHRLHVNFSDGCRILLGLEGVELIATEGLVLARLTTEVQYDEGWEKRRLEWVAMCTKLGRYPSYGSKDPDEKRVSKWQQHQRTNYRNKDKCMTAERIVALETTEGWQWEEEDSWEPNRLHWISQHQRLHRTPSAMSKDLEEKRAGSWQQNQRTYYKNKSTWMTDDRIGILTETDGWKWESEDAWEPNRLRWVTIYAKLGRTPSHGSKDPENKKAGIWQNIQRAGYRNKSAWMTEERIRILTDTNGWKWEEGDPWEQHRLHWIAMYTKLGKTPSHGSKDPEEKKAGKWQQHQRTNRRTNAPGMSEEKISILTDTDGWKWEEEDTWESCRFHWVTVCQTLGKKPSDHSKNKEEQRAAAWQNTQRMNKKKNAACMTDERVAALNATPGWTWSGSAATISAPPANTVEYLTATVSERTRHLPTAESTSVLSHDGAPRKLSELETLHQAYKTRNADTYFDLMRSNPAKFEEYHVVADAHDARDPPERKPQNRIAEMLKKNNRPTYSAVDLGCGRNALRSDERVSKMSWSSVDVIAADSTVTVADMGALPFEDESYDVAVLNRSLWARNHEAVLHEVYRILKEGGRAILCESFRRWQSAGENTLLASLKATGFTVLSEYGTNAESEVSDVFQYIEVRR